MGFSPEVVERAWIRQGERCAACGKRLYRRNRSPGDRGAWIAHHKKPVSFGGGDSLGNCAILCINEPNCHLRWAHRGKYSESAVLYDEHLPFLYYGEDGPRIEI